MHNLSLRLLALLFFATPSFAQTPAETGTATELKVAFFGDQGTDPSATAVLNLVKREKAHAVIHLGDFDYRDDPDAFEKLVNRVLGQDFPYFIVIGNHDVDAWSGPKGYQRRMNDRLARISAAICSGDYGVKSVCRYKGLFLVLSGAGTKDSQHEDYLRDQLAGASEIWKVCAWHKNQKAMQVGGKQDEVGWGPYEVCRKAGAIIATGHEHSYSRTKTLSSIENQTVALSDPNTLRVRPGESFVFVSGLGGAEIRDQKRCLPTKPPYGCNGEWAKIYTSSQSAKHGALFITFNVDGDPRKARGEFKNVDGEIVDSFTILAGVHSPPSRAHARGSVSRILDLGRNSGHHLRPRSSSSGLRTRTSTFSSAPRVRTTSSG